MNTSHYATRDATDPDELDADELDAAELDARTTALVAKVDAARTTPCTGCGATLCRHDGLLNVVLGHHHQPACLRCLANEHGEAPISLRERALQWIRRRDCFRHVWERAGNEERAAGRSCAHGTGAGSAATSAADRGPVEVEVETDAAPVADATFDAGGSSCGDLALELRARVRALEVGAILHLTADSTAARADVPAWCELTGHALLRARHPDYWIRRGAR